MNEFITILKNIELDDSIEKKDYLTNGVYENLPKLIQQAEKACCNHLIKEGKPNYSNMDILRKEGFSVFPGEIDSFGWLTGCVKTKKGIIVFG